MCSTDYTIYNRKCSDLQSGDYVFIHGRPCQIHMMTIFNTEGQTKASLLGIDLFSGENREGHYRMTEIMDIPIVHKIKCRLVSQNGHQLSLAMPEGETREDIPFPTGELGERIIETQKSADAVYITIQSVMGEEAVIDVEVA
ncbi:hypothetical protein ASPWEDRAFT_405675 [Aspergillus wentii DTO 134E9]|uniref:Translation initiation factor 5A C-terminal domain-containing protein n=1 Tax=Aspergillus wentii DTO 134E9 TaxID=1073089 RepID=A0A1L9RNB5_ASPWE|nr:uncharacterized protein ASPWEDRAFT_405675 [Aspergillus wentii DTO 134E9]OJJ36402.1 hypothetical protein ASPWEDRAFT_405675 [Aspergillus wentii DTO 134E9]